MAEAIVQALLNYGNVQLWLAMAIGIVIGLVFGIIPGLSGSVALALLLPFTFGKSPELFLPLMMAILAVQFQGGSISAILLNVPGTVPNTATLIDGFPMTQKGEGGRAIGAALTASAAGSVLTALAALAMIPLVYPIIMALRTADMVFIVLLGLIFIGVLTSASMIKGLISGGTGLLLAFIGYQYTTGMDRFTFGSLYLYDGLPLIPLALGLFAVPEMIALATKGGAIATAETAYKGFRDVVRGIKDVVQHWILVIRCSLIGFIVGLVPGVGGETATFVTYGHAKQTSKEPERFGTGTVEGVIAPETANNAEVAGALLTTLALGIPGNTPMAVLLGAIILAGIVPGPEMLTKHLELSITLIWMVLIAGVIGTLVCLPLTPQLARIAFIPGRVLAPLILIVVFIGSFAYRELVNDIIVLLVFGVVGLVMKRYGYNRPAIFLGFVLGRYFETYLFLALKLDGPLFFLRPISLALILTTIAMLTYGPIKSQLQRRRGVKKTS